MKSSLPPLSTANYPVVNPFQTAQSRGKKSVTTRQASVLVLFRWHEQTSWKMIRAGAKKRRRKIPTRDTSTLISSFYDRLNGLKPFLRLSNDGVQCTQHYQTLAFTLFFSLCCAVKSWCNRFCGQSLLWRRSSSFPLIESFGILEVVEIDKKWIVPRQRVRTS